jgi:hypothetical protein
MPFDPRTLVTAILVGLGATLLIDLWALLLRRGFGIQSLDYCLLGRWILHMPEGRFAHASIGAAEPRRHECAMGWTAHYSIGAGFAVLFVLLAGTGWLARPTIFPALAFGVVTVLVPFLVMQPALGLGLASARAPKPAQARIKSLMTHTIFGLGLYLTALAVAPLIDRN